MINGMTLMLYVKNVNRAVNFWKELGFEELVRIPLEGSETVVISNDDFGNVTLQLYGIDYVRETNPELAENKPTILFSTDDIMDLHEKINTVTRQVGDVVPAGDDYTFTFNDLDGNQFAVRGAKAGQELSAEVIDLYFEQLKNMRLISARDVEFLPDRSFIFFGQVTDGLSREFAEQLADAKRDIYYVDTQTASLSPDLQTILKRYEVSEVPALIRRNANGRFISLNAEEENVEDFMKRM